MLSCFLKGRHSFICLELRGTVLWGTRICNFIIQSYLTRFFFYFEALDSVWTLVTWHLYLLGQTVFTSNFVYSVWKCWMAEVDMSQSIQTYFLYYKGGFGYVLNGSEALGLEGTNPLPPSISSPTWEWTVVWHEFEILIDWLIWSLICLLRVTNVVVFIWIQIITMRVNANISHENRHSSSL